VAGSSPAAGSRLSIFLIIIAMIPKHAKKVFKGTVFDVFQWEQKMFNGTTKIFEVAEQLHGVSIIATVKDKVVVLKQKQPDTSWYFTLPGGYLDIPGETPKQGALRELMEETGLKPSKIKHWNTFERQGRARSKYHVFIAYDCQKVAEQSVDGGEKIEVNLVTFEKFLKLSDETKFHNKDVVIEMLRARVSKQKKAEFKKLIFGK
jgi:ADP-ribose pyrophosphatase